MRSFPGNLGIQIRGMEDAQRRYKLALSPRVQKLLLVPKPLGEALQLFKQRMLNRDHGSHMGLKTAETSDAWLGTRTQRN